MAYVRTHWVESETPLSADNLNNIEDGIEELKAQKVDKVSGKGLSTEDYTTEEKTKLENIENFAKRNQLAWSSIQIGAQNVSARNTEDVFPLEIGDLMDIQVESSNTPDDPRLTKFKIGVNKNSVATPSSNGLMSAADKTKLDGIAPQATSIKIAKKTLENISVTGQNVAEGDYSVAESGWTLAGIVGFYITDGNPVVVGNSWHYCRVLRLYPNGSTNKVHVAIYFDTASSSVTSKVTLHAYCLYTKLLQ